MAGGLDPEYVREIRDAYDDLSEADRAALARCTNAQEIMNERVYWKLAAAASDDTRLRLAHLIACFPAAEQLAVPEGFRTGAFLRRVLHPGLEKIEPEQAQRYRQLTSARDVDELVPRMRRILAEADVPVDWGVLGRDMFDWSEKVRAQWDRDFYGQPTGS